MAGAAKDGEASMLRYATGPITGAVRHVYGLVDIGDLRQLELIACAVVKSFFQLN